MTIVQYYDAERVRAALTWPMVNEAIKAAFIAASNSNQQDMQSVFSHQPTRSITECGANKSQLLFTMPAFVGNYTLEGSTSPKNTLACKLVTSFPENSKLKSPLPNILANILLFNNETGALESIVEATELTAWRTAAASVVATKYLFIDRESEMEAGVNKTDASKIDVAIIGCGVQGESHALGMCATYTVGNLNLWNRTSEKATNLAALIESKHPEVKVTVYDEPAQAVAQADVICIATYSPTHLINYSMIGKHAVHINAVGAGQVHFGEVAQDIYDVAKVYIDSKANAKAELEGMNASIVGEVGEIIKSGKRLPRNGITIFQSMGMAAEDATVSQAVVDAIKKS